MKTLRWMSRMGRLAHSLTLGPWHRGCSKRLGMCIYIYINYIYLQYSITTHKDTLYIIFTYTWWLYIHDDYIYIYNNIHIYVYIYVRQTGRYQVHNHSGKTYLQPASIMWQELVEIFLREVAFFSGHTSFRVLQFQIPTAASPKNTKTCLEHVSRLVGI
jgi:hypothetical protein